MYNGQNEYVPYKKRTKRFSNGQGTHLPVTTDKADIVTYMYWPWSTLPLLFPRLLSFSKVFIIMHEYVNKIICILSYDKTNRTLYRLSFVVRLMISISKGKNTPIVLKDKLSLKSKLISYAIFFRLSSLPKSVASYCKKGR